jgi:hypothetical protein
LKDVRGGESGGREESDKIKKKAGFIVALEALEA